LMTTITFARFRLQYEYKSLIDTNLKS